MIDPKNPVALTRSSVENARLHANRHDLIRFLKPRLRSGIIAEIGVAHGLFSRFLLDEIAPARFDAYDVFSMHTWQSAWGKDPAFLLEGKTHRTFFEAKFRQEIQDGILRVCEGDSAPTMARSDVFYDMIYVDGDHAFDGVLRDANAAVSKLKPNGILIFNDYIMHDHLADVSYGIVPVVNDLCEHHGWRMTHLALQPQMFADVALERAVAAV